MKKYSKIFSFAFLVFFASISSVFAKELTLSEFEKEVEEKQPNASYVYVIGNYAFTSLHKLTTEDVMLSARSIQLSTGDGYTNEEPAYGKMTISMLQRTYDDNFNPKGWEKGNNILGKEQLSDDKLNIRYIDYDFLPEVSKAEISVDLEKEEFKKYKEVLKSALNFEPESYYGKNSAGQNALTYTNGKVSGLLLKKKDISLNDADKEKYENANYFFAYVLEVPGANVQTKIKLKGLDGEEKDVSYDNFDVKDEDNKTPGIVILVPVDYSEFQKLSTKTITITVDLDGDDNKEYEATTYTLDLSGLTFQGESTANVTLNSANEKDKKILSDWGYKDELSKELKLENGSLTGKIYEQVLTNDEAFGSENKEGYYFDFKFVLPEGVTKEQAKISQLSSGDNHSVIKTFNVSDFDDENNLTILYRFSSDTSCVNNENCKLYFELDYDGTDGQNYLPTMYTIDYSDVTFVKRKEITYSYKDNKGEIKTETDKAHEGEPIVKELSSEDTEYRKFDGWYDFNGQKVENIPNIDEASSDNKITLTAHWNINADEFISEVVEDLNSQDTTYSDDFEGKIDLVQNETNKNEITINVEKPNISLTELAETSIPGSIAYILDKDEIKDITLTVGSQNVQFNKEYEANNGKEYEDNSERKLLTDTAKNLKTEIVKGAKEAFDTELSGNEAYATLDQVEYNEKTFALTIGNTDDTVTLVDSEGNEVTDTAKKTYTFKFDSDFVVVDADNELGATNLKEALDKDYTKVYLNSDVEVTAPIDIEKENSELFIEPLETSSSPVVAAVNSILEKEVSEISNDKESKTISVTDGDYVIDVKSGNVTLKDVKISGATKAELKVEEGANVTVENVDVSGINETPKTTDEEVKAAIIVNGKLTANNVKNENESYALPTIATVASDSSTTTSENKVTVSGMTKNDKFNLVDRTTNTKFHSVKSYNGEFYYNDVNNSKIYFASVMDTVQGVRPSPYQAFQIYFYGETVDFSKFEYVSNSKPEKDGKVFKEFKLGSATGQTIQNEQLAQNVFGSNSEILLYAIYESTAPTE